MHIWPKKSKLSFYDEIWYLDQFEYAEFDDAIQFFSTGLEILFLGKLGQKRQSFLIK